MTASERRRRYRAVLAGAGCVHPASVYDPISARIAEEIGFEVGMFAGSTASLTVLGAPDLVVLTLTEFADQARRINRALAAMPVMVDADHGYGNALSVKRTVEELEAAGVAALTIEDTVLPVPFGAGAGALVSIAEGVGKMRAALAGRGDPALSVIGRTSAMALAGEAEMVARAQADEAAGVDALFLVGVSTRAQLDAVSSAVSLPLVLGSAPPPLDDLGYLASRRVRMALQGHLPIVAAAQAVYATLKALRDGEKPAGMADEGLMKRVTRDRDYRAWISEFLGGGSV